MNATFFKKSLIQLSISLWLAGSAFAQETYTAKVGGVAKPLEVLAVGQAPKKYDMDYMVSGEPTLQPAQVFDDGQSTYFRLKTDAIAPTILAIGPHGPQPLRLLKSSPYFVVNATAQKFEVRYGQLVATVIAKNKQQGFVFMGANAALLEPQPATPTVPSSQRAGELPQRHVAYGAVKPNIGDEDKQPGFVEKLTPVPFAKDKIRLSEAAENAILQSLAVPGRIVKVTITGRENLDAAAGIASLRSNAIRDRVLASGVDIENIVMRTGISDETSPELAHSLISVVWQKPAQAKAQAIQQSSKSSTIVGQQLEVKASDVDLPTTLQRWAASRGWTVVWEAKARPQVTANAVYHSEFLESASSIIGESRKMGHKFESEAFSNNVLVVRDLVQ